jgi:putative transposase
MRSSHHQQGVALSLAGDGSRWPRARYSGATTAEQAATQECFRRLLKGLTYMPRVLITDKLQSYGAATRESLPVGEYRQHRSLNNRAENAHQPPRQRERRMQGFKGPEHAQRFLSASGTLAPHCRPRWHRYAAPAYRQEMRQRCQV